MGRANSTSRSLVDAKAPVQLAAGCLVWRVHKGTLQVLAVHRPGYDDWSWPKGKIEPGESLPECAIRETAEETGRQVRLGIPLPTLSYPVNGGRRIKRVLYWSAQSVSRKDPIVAARGSVPRAGNEEIDAVRWLVADRAATTITRDSDLEPLAALQEAHAAGRLTTVPFALLRHANARKRSNWSAGEDSRPLTRAGTALAARLPGLLSAYGLSDVWSSPWCRCLQTLDPYLEVTGLELHRDKWLTESDHRHRPQRTVQLMDRLLAAGLPTVVCTHRPVLPVLLSQLERRCPPELLGAIPSSDPFLRPGQMLVAHVNQQGRVRAVEVHRPS